MVQSRVSGETLTTLPDGLARRSSEQRHKADHFFYFATDLSAHLASNHRGDRKGDGRRASWVLMHRGHACLRNPSGASEDGICAFLREKRCRPSERVSCVGRSTRLSSSKFDLSLIGNAKDNSSSHKDAAPTVMFHKVFAE